MDDIKRSSPYPSILLSEAVSDTEIVRKKFGIGTWLKREDIASALGCSVGAVTTRVSSCIQYGLMEKSHKEGYKPAPLIKKFVSYLNEKEKTDAAIESIQSPALYQKLLFEYNNHVLPENLPTILNRSHKISESAAESAANIFKKNLSDNGFIDESGIIKFPLKNGAPNEERAEDSPAVSNNGSLLSALNLKASSHVNNEVLVTGKKIVVVRLPIDYNLNDLKILEGWIGNLKLRLTLEDEEKTNATDEDGA